MDYFDNVLNVFGYLRFKSNLVAQNTTEIVSNLRQVEKINEVKAKELETNLAKMNNLSDEITESLQEVEKLGLPADLIQELNSVDFHLEPIVLENTSPFDIPVPEIKKIPLPGDMDFTVEFQKLVDDAKKNGYNNVHPGDLLTESEMTAAMEYNRRLDEQFSQATGLTSRDMIVVSVGVVLYSLNYIVCSKPLSPKGPPSANTQRDASFADTFSEFDMPLHKFGKTHEDNHPIDYHNENDYESLKSGFRFVTEAYGLFSGEHGLRIKDPMSILSDTPSFVRVTEDCGLNVDEILGYDKLLGWFAGVFNIMTDTVTRQGFETFQTKMSDMSGRLYLSDKGLSFVDLVSLVANVDFTSLRDTLFAAICREAYVLIPNEIGFETIQKMYYHVCSASDDVKQKISYAASNLGFAFDYGWNALINYTLIAIHGLLYRKEDEDKSLYSCRTMKILSVASTISAIIDSMPGILCMDITKLDISGAINALVNTINSVRFWVDVKAEFLTSEYRQIYEREIANLDKYFK